MLVYVIAQNDKPLMPTGRLGKVRWLLKQKRAKVVKHVPFTIQLTYGTGSERVQPTSLGVDAGSVHVGLSVSTDKKELFAAEMANRPNIPQKLATRREARRTRRSRLRYRAPRFNNRRRPDGWLTPTMRTKLDSHLNIVENICSILPISKIIVETASFDIQKIKDDDIEGKRYQEGEMLGYENVKLYVKARDGYKCCACGKSDHLEVHHLKQRKDGGSDRPENLIVLCETCHYKHHHIKPLDIPAPKDNGFRGATEMNTMRWFLLGALKKLYQNVENTYGYITNHSRNVLKLEKSHINDAFCIAGNHQAARCDCIFNITRIRSHNRQVMKMNIMKGGKLKRNQSSRIVKGIALFDLVRYEDGRIMFVSSRKERGLYSLKPSDGSKTLTDVPRKRFSLIQHSNGETITRRKAFPIPGQAW